MKISGFLPQSTTGQMMAVMALAFTLLLIILAGFEFLEYDNVTDTAESDYTTRRLVRILPIVQSIREEEISAYLDRVSHCHEGYSLSNNPYRNLRPTNQTDVIQKKLASALSIDTEMIHVGFTNLVKEDFSYRDCLPTEMKFPLEGIVVSLQIVPNHWLNAEIHPHEWHITPSMNDWLVRSGVVFFLIGGISLLFIRRVSKPFKDLTDAANTFASDFKVSELKVTGAPDVKRAIQSFNKMQRQVTDEMNRRTNTLAAISHDIRSPLTALRLKAELIENIQLRDDQIASIEKMERITASALAFLRGESRNEPKRKVDLGALVDSVCADYRVLGASVSFECRETIHFTCRPDALFRAVNNLVENAIKYAGSAAVVVKQVNNHLEIVVSDNGPGITPQNMELVFEPFERLSESRNSDAGGFGLGLAIVKAIAEGHDGVVKIEENVPNGLVVIMRLPIL